MLFVRDGVAAGACAVPAWTCPTVDLPRHSTPDNTSAEQRERPRVADDLPRNASSPVSIFLQSVASAGRFDERVPNSADVTWTLTTPAIGFLIDCLKVCGTEADFEAAAALLDQDRKFKVRSAFGPRTAFRKYLKDKRSEDWVGEAFASEPLAAIWFGAYLNTFEQYVLAPGRPRQE